MGSRLAVVVAVLGVFVGCQLNLYALELLGNVPNGKALGGALTFLQFLGVTVANVPVLFNDDRPRAPFAVLTHFAQNPLSFRPLLALSLVFYLVSVGNNVVLNFGVSIPVHSVFRASSLVVSMAVGFLWRGRRYTLAQVTCCVAVTVGITLVTLASSKSPVTECGSTATGACEAAIPSASTAEAAPATDAGVWWWCGIAVLCGTTLGGAATGQLQDKLYSDARKHHSTERAAGMWQHALFWTHAVSMALFAVVGAFTDAPLVGGGVLEQFGMITDAMAWPLALNVGSQILCIRSVYSLVHNTSALTMTLTITMRKFASVVVSAAVFGHYSQYGSVHYAAFALVVAGGTVYPLLSPPGAPKP